MLKIVKYSPGDKVTIKESGHTAVVNAVRIERGCEFYECHWWIEKRLEVAMISESDLEEFETSHKLEIETVESMVGKDESSESLK